MHNERHAYESSKPRWKKPGQRARADDTEANDSEAWLRCIRCGERVTREHDRCERGGLHEHSQINPHGYIWVFGCFERAPGARAHGEPTSEFSWFAGTRWQLCECKVCALHLGWKFAGDGDSFWGLILARLVV